MDIHNPSVTIPAAVVLCCCSVMGGCVGCTAIDNHKAVRLEEIRTVSESQRQDAVRALVAAGKNNQEIRDLLYAPDPDRAKKLSEAALRLRSDSRYSTSEAKEIILAIAEGCR